MTAEVAVMNKMAVALAADSKVTVGGARGGKTYDTVNKLFTLSKFHPVGIMIYGNAEFMGYPWEVIIKLYRRQKGTNLEATIRAWSEDFMRFVARFGAIEDEHISNNLKAVCGSWFAALLDEAEDTAIAQDIPIGGDDYIQILKQIMKSALEKIAQEERWLTDREATKFIKEYGPIVDSVTETMIHPYDDGELNELAERLISAAILFKHASPMFSGIVVAGFGEEEYFPTFIAIETDGYIGAGIKAYEDSFVDISRSCSGCVQAFAQREMVDRFMSGIDSELYSVMMKAFGSTLEESGLAVLEKYGSAKKKTAANKDAVQKASRASIKKLSEKVVQLTTRAYSHPIVRMVSLLPKDELANLAESLVALTSLKRRVSSDTETVGGAIDVALISKGDGFVWIKRKYYFPENLNPQFNKMYLQHHQGAVDEKEREPPGGSRRAPGTRRARPSKARSGQRSSRASQS